MVEPYAKNKSLTEKIGFLCYTVVVDNHTYEINTQKTCRKEYFHKSNPYVQHKCCFFTKVLCFERFLKPSFYWNS